MKHEPTDLTTPPDLGHERRTGPDRAQRPIYLDLLPPCNQACPAGENIQAWLALATEGRFREAWEVIARDNPMPAVHGRVCYHPCEVSCNREKLDTAVSIHAVERFLGDLALEENWTLSCAQSTGKRVLIVGAGPSGLSCAHHLSLLGHEVEIREAGPLPGGMMHFGIPSYRLPRQVLEAEVQRIEGQGVKIVFNHKVENLAQEREGFDAVFLAVGAHLGKKTDIPARDAGKMLDAVQFLRDFEMGNAPKLGRRVAVYGGGNTAMDVARIARRMGVEPLIIYRRDREHMPAHESEADDALTEGVKIHWLRTIKSMDEGELTIEVMKLDEKGRPVPTGELETLQADDLILALGQDTDTEFLRDLPGITFEKDGTVVVDRHMMTGCTGVFAGGDMVPAERTVTVAVGHGKKAARNIDAFLQSDSYDKVKRSDVATFDKLHLWFYADAAQRSQAELDLERRNKSFEEVLQGLSADEAQFESKRCLSCGNCFECDGCYGACPEDAIEKLGPGLRYRVNLDKCTGCGTCFEQCPSGAITLTPEPVKSQEARA
ncbi:MAG: NAD(P)-binding protein [Fimbriimonadaceae bacterium]|nr:NAD(P)-binding protein [Fimbriimonadaceae bacterium]